ncbi:hypothetical protein QG041_02440 [Kingella kingae]|nr:hypothetical protein [Kingella kingae]MDK4566348.1 hypothetical protein [Kingella kingae]MDK4568225.1 hypothetical protein [Kingella kingae]MDK4570148.1 hypothetical protein [Kingella kingae]MDK4572085.1 hypothetical protein [Kingella kingae]MDK4585960.1 hypothetical protein [Kingella kingae]
MPTTLILDPKIYEFETKNAADEYTEWLQNEVRQSRLSPIISEEQAMNKR